MEEELVWEKVVILVLDIWEPMGLFSILFKV